jgi:hypothetical protein
MYIGRCFLSGPNAIKTPPHKKDYFEVTNYLSKSISGLFEKVDKN